MQALMRDVRKESRGSIRMIPVCQAGFVGEVVYLGMQNRMRGLEGGPHVSAITPVFG